MRQRSFRNGNRAFTGLLLVGIGAALFLRNMNFPFLPDILFSWPMILVVLGIYSGFRHQFRNNSWLILIGLGGFFMVDEFIPGISHQPFFWPMAIITLGLIFLIRPHRSQWPSNFQNQSTAESFAQVADTDSTNGNPQDFLQISSVFSGVNRRVLSKNFKGGNISCVFGGAEIDFLQADIQGIVVLKIEAVFGGTKLMVPPDWIVVSDIEGIFHGMDDKRMQQQVGNVDTGKTLLLKGSCVFAGIEIKSY